MLPNILLDYDIMILPNKLVINVDTVHIQLVILIELDKLSNDWIFVDNDLDTANGLNND